MCQLIKFLFEKLPDIYYKTGSFYTVVKTMDELKFCQQCNQRHKCQEVYRQLGKTEGPSVVFKVVVAFLLPLVVFIGALAAFEGILAGAINSKEMRTALSFLLALPVTFVCIFVLKAINRQVGKNK